MGIPMHAAAGSHDFGRAPDTLLERLPGCPLSAEMTRDLAGATVLFAQQRAT